VNEVIANAAGSVAGLHGEAEAASVDASLLPANAMMPEAMRPGCAEALAMDGRFSPTGGCGTF
jgi:hypothetical protein